jgi:CheY-specific phosphatase CheX
LISIERPVINAVSQVFEMYGESTLKWVDTVCKSGGFHNLHGQLVVVIGITGSNRGRMIFNYDQLAHDEMLQVLFGTPEDHDEQIKLSAFSEITNIIAGKIICHPELGDDLDITPPTLLVGSDFCFSSSADNVDYFTFALGAGILQVVISLEQ